MGDEKSRDIKAELDDIARDFDRAKAHRFVVGAMRFGMFIGFAAGVAVTSIIALLIP